MQRHCKAELHPAEVRIAMRCKGTASQGHAKSGEGVAQIGTAEHRKAMAAKGVVTSTNGPQRKSNALHSTVMQIKRGSSMIFWQNRIWYKGTAYDDLHAALEAAWQRRTIGRR